MSDSSETEDEFEGYFADIDRAAGHYSARSCARALALVEDLVVENVPTEHRCGLMRRHAEYLYILSNYQTMKEQRIEMLEKAYKIARQGHLTDPTDFECAKVLCSTCGRLAEESPLKKKLDYGFKFKTYLDEAIALNDKDFETTHMRGRFCYTVASLSFVERMAAKLIGQIPKVTYEDALRDLLKADELDEGVSENQLFIGKTYLEMGDYANAKKWLTRAACVHTNVAVEAEYAEDARHLLEDKRLKAIQE
ncbi:unnamed protein product [Caenorhabditis sp. 36 PRJEB53466]|nr:unnamed protein product [Caenorhabditis sp. 36 PRJEB53466]